MPPVHSSQGVDDVVQFDTPDRRLYRAGVVLSRHSGAGWHLSLPVPLSPGKAGKKPEKKSGPGDPGSWTSMRPRVELDEPLGTNPTAVPPVFLALTRARALGQPLGQVDPGATPEQADGAESAAAQEPAGIALAHLASQLDRLISYDSRVRLGVADAVRQARVSIRKLRSDLVTFRPLFVRDRADPLRAELAWLSGVLGEARDAEVTRERLLAELDAEVPEMIIGPVRVRVERELGLEYRQAQIAVIQALNSVRYLDLLKGLGQFIQVPPLVPGASLNQAEALEPTEPTEPAEPVEAAWRQRRDGELTALVATSHARLLKAHRVAAAAASPQEREFLLHEVRKAAKRSRYAADAVLPVLGKPAKRYAKAAARVQGVLGDQQDAVVLRARLLTLAARATLAAENSFTYGRLHARLEQRARLDESELETAWEQLIEVAGLWPE